MEIVMGGRGFGQEGREGGRESARGNPRLRISFIGNGSKLLAPGNVCGAMRDAICFGGQKAGVWVVSRGAGGVRAGFELQI